jgi:hypothetical protein
VVASPDPGHPVLACFAPHPVRPRPDTDLAPWSEPGSEAGSLKWPRRGADDEAVALSTPSYDPRVIEQFAEKLYRKASAFVAGSIVIGVALGAAFGAVPLTSLGAAWPIPSMFGFATLLLGGLLGGVVGYVIGDTRSFGYRLQAQAALCQLQTERNTAVIAAAAAAARTPKTAPSPPTEEPASPPVTPPVSARVA